MLYPFLHIVHLVTVILWIGGLAFITILILPMIVKMPDALQKALLFQRIEHRFAPLARYFAAVVGITGFTMFFTRGLGDTLLTREGHSLLFMIAVWSFWVVMLFGLEPLIIKKLLDNMASEGGNKGKKPDIDAVFSRMKRLHWVLLTLSLAAAASGAIFAHGFI